MASFAIVQDELAGPSEQRRPHKSHASPDRFVADNSEHAIPLCATPRSRRLAKAIGEAGDRRLSFHSHENVKPAAHSRDSVPFRKERQCLTRSLYEIPSPPSITSASTNLCAQPEICLGAPGLDDDFYSRLAAWSQRDLLAVAMTNSVVFRNMQTHTIGRVAIVEADENATCISWSPDSLLAIGNNLGITSVYEPDTRKLLREFEPRNDMHFVGDFSWKDTNVLTIGYHSGQMLQFDMREPRGGRMIRSHKARICGIEWNPDGRFLATGGGDGIIVCWDARANKSGPLATFGSDTPLFATSKSTLNLSSSQSSSIDGGSSSNPDLSSLTCRWRSRKHLSTVKALAWCPWSPELLATGGGTKDGAIRFWDAARGRQKKLVINTHSQVTSLHFAPNCREIVSTHGYAFATSAGMVLPAPRKHSVLVHRYPGGEATGVLLNNTSGKEFSVNSNSSKTGCQWSFSFRGGCDSDCDSSDGEGDDGSLVQQSDGSKDANASHVKAKGRTEALSEDGKLLRDLDISTRAEVDAAEFKANPWSIARINAASRTSFLPDETVSNPHIEAFSGVCGSQHRTQKKGIGTGLTGAAAAGDENTNLRAKPKQTVDGFFSAGNVARDNTNKKTVNTYTGRADRTAKLASGPLRPSVFTSSSQSKISSVVLADTNSKQHENHKPTQMLTGTLDSEILSGGSVHTHPTPTGWRNTFAATQGQDYFNSMQTNVTPINMIPDSDFLEHLTTDDYLSNQLVDCSCPPILYLEHSTSTPDLAVCAEEASFSSHAVTQPTNISPRRPQGPFASPLRRDSGVLGLRTLYKPIAVTQTASPFMLAGANTGLPRDHEDRELRSKLPGRLTQSALHKKTNQSNVSLAFSSPLRQTHLGVDPSSRKSEWQSGRTALGLSTSGSSLYKRDEDQSFNPNSDHPSGHDERVPFSISKLTRENTNPSCPPMDVHVSYGDKEAEEIKPYSDVLTFHPPDLTSFTNPRSQAQHSPPSSPPRFTFPLKRTSNVFTNHALDESSDAYSALRDEDAEWSTLPTRKKARKSVTRSIGGSKSIKQSGRFKLPIALPRSSAKDTTPTGGENLAKRRVVTYLPPPRGAQVSTVLKSNDSLKEMKQEKPATEWSIKRFGFGYNAGSAFAGCLKLKKYSTDTHEYMFSNNDERGPSPSDDSDATLFNSSSQYMHTLAKKSEACSTPDDNVDVFIAFDAAELENTYPIQRKAAAHAVWGDLGLPSCGVSLIDATSGETSLEYGTERTERTGHSDLARKEMEIVVWSGFGRQDTDSEDRIEERVQPASM
ncbi:hypothetical protein EW145_g4677 [Phellinidium pouzarii]|uniref:CDC20/Fizzy WD40 domain-containing protein n=1 Tax=Phellinidium pouzarii TaxID=167371 RepID=A0A4S4L2U8_9AGAM|nr:hypothetical protein EW145_g4677 [Phellinidium pouzarii]